MIFTFYFILFINLLKKATRMRIWRDGKNKDRWTSTKKKGILYKVILHELGWSIGLVFQSSFRGGFLYIWAAVKGMI